jgi:hypothetical protein
MTGPSPWISGGCLCGGLRYAVDPAGVFDAGYCHCSICRRASGAPVLAWAALHAASFRLTSGTPAHYWSSPACRRSFCPVCGGQLFYDGPEMQGMTGIHTATLDAPAPPELRPRLHMCVSDRLPWFTTADTLPHFPDNRLTHPATRPATLGRGSAAGRSC